MTEKIQKGNSQVYIATRSLFNIIMLMICYDQKELLQLNSKLLLYYLESQQH